VCVHVGESSDVLKFVVIRSLMFLIAAENFTNEPVTFFRFDIYLFCIIVYCLVSYLKCTVCISKCSVVKITMCGSVIRDSLLT